jgi:CubicO group peptidase (beta-lactamase class C family)
MHFLLFILFIFSSCGKSSGHTVNPATVQGISAEFGLPALASVMIQKNLTVEENFTGVRKFGELTPIQSDDAFHIGSCTKAMTSTLAGILIEEGKLNWDSTLATLLPDVNLHPLYQNMRFDLLLVHRAGLNEMEDGLFSKLKALGSENGKELVLKTLLERAPSFTPGTAYVYSNYGYIIAGRILERLTGKSWETLIQEKIFNPLSMATCGFGPAPLVWGHLRSSGKIIPVFSDNPIAFGPAGRVHCSMNDWGKFLTIHMKGFRGENAFLKAETFKKLHSTYSSNDSSYTYGGWNLIYRSWAKGMTLSHAGSNTMNYAKVWIAPEVESILMSATNIGGENVFEATDTAIKNMINGYLN